MGGACGCSRSERRAKICTGQPTETPLTAPTRLVAVGTESSLLAVDCCDRPKPSGNEFGSSTTSSPATRPATTQVLVLALLL